MDKNKTEGIRTQVAQVAQVSGRAWALSAGAVMEELGTTENGLSAGAARERLSAHGSNTFHSKEKVNITSLFFRQFLSPLIFLLIAAAVLTGILHEWIDTTVIALAVLLNVSLGFYHEYHAESTLEKLTTYIKDRSTVKRDGFEQEIDSSLLVPGDVIKLSYGSRVPADARILTVNDFSVDEAVLTGESMPVSKHDEPLALTTLVAERKNIAHAGTLVVQGYATAVVYATGNQTEIGKIAGIVSDTKRVKTPLQEGVGRLAWFIFGIVSVVIVGILALGIARGEALIPMLILSAAVAVGSVPESLPIALTVILAIGAERIAEKKGIVRKLTAAETLGSTTLIMTDKTGTLTKADMQLVGIHETSRILSGHPHKDINKDLTKEQKDLLALALFNVDVSIENPNEERDKWVFRGRTFEVNIAKASKLHDVPLAVLSSSASHLVLPFNSSNKFSISDKGDEYVLMGAPDILLAKAKIDESEYQQIESWIDKESRDGKRLVGIGRASKKHTEPSSLEDIKDIEFLGVFAFYDPIRPEVPQAIKNIESYGVKMVLITGDLVGTALSVAKSIDWQVGEEEVLTGADIQALSDEKMLSLIPRIKIFARVTPEDKLRIGRLYQKLGEVVAMTGDGVNDAPALKAMDIGISLGSGSDVAKSASDLVLLDDNFQTISSTINEGRRILSNIRKTFAYLLSSSFGEVFVIGGSLIFDLALPLTALQIIWVNLMTDSLPALAFAWDEHTDKDKPVGAGTTNIVFNRNVKALILGVGVLSSSFLFILYYVLVKIGLPIDLARSIFFVCFSSYILAVAFSFRSLRSPLFSYDTFGNKTLNMAIALGFVILLVTMISPFMRNIFELAPMPLIWLPFVLLWLVFNVSIAEGAKYLVRRIN
jgi:P-type Ca2+ transporter type 2C